MPFPYILRYFIEYISLEGNYATFIALIDDNV